MKKLYFIIPVVFALIFSYFYFTEKNEIKAKLDADKARQEQDAADRKQKEAEKVEQARKDAVVQAAQRAQEREEKRIKEDEQKATLQAATDDRATALQDRERYYKQSLKLQEDVTAAKEQVRRAREAVKLQEVQVAYIKGSLKEVTDRRAVYQDAENKIRIADAAIATAEAARAAAAATKR